MDNRILTLGSLFDGIGGFPFAATIVGIKPIWAAEIDPACVAVTKNRFPSMEHLGSVTDIDGAKITPVDIITFGSPCQDLSVAGKRAGLDGERSGLFKEAIRIIYEMRLATNGKNPTFIIWENVPGAFSSNKGHDFRTVLEEITKANIPMPTSGKWANAGVVRGGAVCAAWRLLDAQYWGVPQRRKRIYLVGSFGSNSAEEILFKCDSVRRYLTQSRTSWQGITGNTESGTTIANTIGTIEGKQYTIDFGRTADRIQVNPQQSVTLLAEGGGAGAKSGLYLVPQSVAGFNGQNSITANDIEMREELSPTITCKKQADVLYSAGFLDRAPAEAYTIGFEKEISPTLRAKMIPSVVVQKNVFFEAYQHHEYRQANKAGVITAGQNGTIRGDTPIIISENTVCFDDIVTEEDGHKWAGICKSCKEKHNIPENLLDEYGSGICGVEGCENEANYYLDFPKEEKPPVLCIQGKSIGRADKNAPNGSGINKDISFTLNTVDQHAVCYGLPLGFRPENTKLYDKKATTLCNGTCPDFCNGTAYEKPIALSSVSSTLRAGAGAPKHEQDFVGRLVCQRYTNSSFDGYTECVGTPKVSGSDYDDGSKNILVKCLDTYNAVISNNAHTLQTPHGANGIPHAMYKQAIEWIVRRLTPLECEWLQGYPDYWTKLPKIENMTDEEYSFFLQAFMLDKSIKGQEQKKLPTKTSLVKWYNKLDCDGNRYKMCGNSLAIPCALRVLGDIADYIAKEE